MAMTALITQDNITQVRVAAELAYRGNGNAQTHANEQELDDLNQQSQKIEALMTRIEAFPDPEARALMQESVQTLLNFYGDGLARILRLVTEAEAPAQKVYDTLLRDSFVGGLLLIHDLYPVPLETRINEALQKVRPYMDTHGGNVELVSLENGVAKLRLQGSCKGCPSSSATLDLAIKQAIEEACPDLLGLEVEGVVPPPEPKKLFKILNQPQEAPTPRPKSGWTIVESMTQLGNGAMKIVEVAGVPLLICKVNAHLYAYRNACAACDMPFDVEALKDGLLSCRLNHRFDAQRAGICTDDPDIHLNPFPLLMEDGMVKVALG